jgi:hypothetical protein
MKIQRALETAPDLDAASPQLFWLLVSGYEAAPWAGSKQAPEDET